MSAIDAIEKDLEQAGISPAMLPMAAWCLRQLYDGDSVGEMKTCCRALALNGADWADENKVLRSLLAMEGKFVASESERAGMASGGEGNEDCTEGAVLMGLHNQILNLPPMDKAGKNALPKDSRSCYSLGHRDARHQAAELALQHEERSRRAAQLLIEVIGAPGPENVDETAARAAEQLRRKDLLIAGTADAVREMHAACEAAFIEMIYLEEQCKFRKNGSCDMALQKLRAVRAKWGRPIEEPAAT